MSEVSHPSSSIVIDSGPAVIGENFKGQIKDVQIFNQVYTPGTLPITGSDTIAPTAPTSLDTLNLTQTSVTLLWAGSTDAIGVTGYIIYRNGIEV